MSDNIQYLTTQIITYIGNKRTLIYDIESQIKEIQAKLGKEKLIIGDLFAGSGIVSRIMKGYASHLHVNDLEAYSHEINSCYLTNKEDFNEERYNNYKTLIEQNLNETLYEGIITKNYAPKDDNNICMGERAFYTHSNALKIDTYRNLIDEIVDPDYRKFFLAPLITEASIHVNTSGVFKGFYKDRTTGVGCFGGKARNALFRIQGEITLPKPILSNYSCKTTLYQEDTIDLSKKLKGLDVTYLDPPYNQHPYGSNYFMLNLILKNKIDASMSKVSGILTNWNRSVFNRRKDALRCMEEIIYNLDSKFIVISYNSEGFISFNEMQKMLEKYGSLKTVEIKYNTFRGSRNLKNRDIHVSEYLFVLEKLK